MRCSIVTMAHPDGDGRGRHVAAHVSCLRKLVATATLKVSGPSKGTALRSGSPISAADTRAEAEALVAADPFAIEGPTAKLSVTQ